MANGTLGGDSKRGMPVVETRRVPLAAQEQACTLVSANGTQVRTLVGASGLLFDVTEAEDASLPVVDVGLGATSIQNLAAGTFTGSLHLDLTVTGSNVVNIILWWAASGDFDPLVQVASVTLPVSAGPETVDLSDSVTVAESGVFFAVLEFTTGDACSVTVLDTSTMEVCGG